MTYEEALDNPYDLGDGRTIPLQQVLAVLEDVQYHGKGLWTAKCPCCDDDSLSIAVPDVVDRIN
jgi:hypothetical protein